MQRVSIGRRLSRRWMLLVAVVVVAVAGFAVYRLHGIFASQDVTSTPSGGENDIVPFNPKHVVLEVFGPPGTVATITYLDVNAQPQRADAVDAALGLRHDHHPTGGLRQRLRPGRQRLDRLPNQDRRRGQGREIGEHPERLHLLPGQVRMSTPASRGIGSGLHPAVLGADRAVLAGPGGASRTSSCRSWRPSPKRTTCR